MPFRVLGDPIQEKISQADLKEKHWNVLRQMSTCWIVGSRGIPFNFILCREYIYLNIDFQSYEKKDHYYYYYRYYYYVISIIIIITIIIIIITILLF